MKLEKLKSIRTYVPAIILGLLIQLFSTSNYDELSTYFKDLLEFNFENATKLVVYVGFGFLYNSLRWRKFLFNPYLIKVQENINTRLISIIEKRETLSYSDKRNFIESKKGMNLFYKIVDSDPSLTVKSELVKHNGALWSSLTDIVILSTVFLILEFGKYIIYMDNYYLSVSGLLLGVCIVASILNHVTVNHHISLSNEQLDIIEQQFSHKLYDEFKS